MNIGIVRASTPVRASTSFHLAFDSAEKHNANFGSNTQNNSVRSKSLQPSFSFALSHLAAITQDRQMARGANDICLPSKLSQNDESTALTTSINIMLTPATTSWRHSAQVEATVDRICCLVPGIGKLRLGCSKNFCWLCSSVAAFVAVNAPRPRHTSHIIKTKALLLNFREHVNNLLPNRTALNKVTGFCLFSVCSVLSIILLLFVRVNRIFPKRLSTAVGCVLFFVNIFVNIIVNL